MRRGTGEMKRKNSKRAVHPSPRSRRLQTEESDNPRVPVRQLLRPGSVAVRRLFARAIPIGRFGQPYLAELLLVLGHLLQHLGQVPHGGLKGQGKHMGPRLRPELRGCASLVCAGRAGSQSGAPECALGLSE